MVSVIVPIYNVAPDVQRTLDELRRQTYQDAEFLIIDDGSTDNTWQLVNDWLSRTEDTRFKVLHKANGGVSDARNFGLKQASGRYVVFIDGDDRQEATLLDQYVAMIETSQHDIDFFAIERLDDRGKSEGVEQCVHHQPVNGTELLVLLGSQVLGGYPWAYISKRSLWQNVQFDTQLKFYEDVAVLANVILNVPDLMAGFSNSVQYYYVQHDNSALHSMKFDDFNDFVVVAEQLLDVARRLKLSYGEQCRVRGQLLSAYLSIALIALFWNMDDEYNQARRLFMNTLPKVKYTNRKTQVKRYIQGFLFALNCREIIKKIYDKAYVV